MVHNVPPARQLVRINLDESFITLDPGLARASSFEKNVFGFRCVKASAASGEITEEKGLHLRGDDM